MGEAKNVTVFDQYYDKEFDGLTKTQEKRALPEVVRLLCEEVDRLRAAERREREDRREHNRNYTGATDEQQVPGPDTSRSPPPELCEIGKHHEWERTPLGAGSVVRTTAPRRSSCPEMTDTPVSR